jgi:hypothetical protein
MKVLRKNYYDKYFSQYDLQIEEESHSHKINSHKNFTHSEKEFDTTEKKPPKSIERQRKETPIQICFALALEDMLTAFRSLLMTISHNFETDTTENENNSTHSPSSNLFFFENLLQKNSNNLFDIKSSSLKPHYKFYSILNNEANISDNNNNDNNRNDDILIDEQNRQMKHNNDAIHLKMISIFRNLLERTRQIRIQLNELIKVCQPFTVQKYSGVELISYLYQHAIVRSN